MTLKHGSKSRSVMTSQNTQNEKQNSFSTHTNRLTPSELESLRKEMDEAKDLIFALMAKDKLI